MAWFPCCCEPQCYCLTLLLIRPGGVQQRIYPGIDYTFTVVSGGYTVNLTVTDIEEFICSLTGNQITFEVQITGGTPMPFWLSIAKPSGIEDLTTYNGTTETRTESITLIDNPGVPNGLEGTISFARYIFGLPNLMFAISWEYVRCDEPESALDGLELDFESLFEEF